MGFRVLLLGKIIDYVSLNPFTGSGFLGCWIMFDDLKCSAHNQYADVLFRTGFVGLYIYLYILYKIFVYLKHNHQDLFYGFGKHTFVWFVSTKHLKCLKVRLF